MTKQKRTQQELHILDLIFDKKTNWQTLEVTYHFKDDYFRKAVFYHYKKMGRSGQPFSDFASLYIYFIYTALSQLEDISNIKKTLKHIYTRAGHDLVDYFRSQNGFRYYRNEDTDVMIYFSDTSLDVEFEADSKMVTHKDFLNEDASAFESFSGKYYKGSVLNWYFSNKDILLTKHQIDFLDKYNQIPQEVVGKERDDMLGISSSGFDSSCQRIAKRLARKYNDLQPICRSDYYQQTEKVQHLLTDILKMVETDSNLDIQNQEVFHYIADHFETLQPLVKLKLEEHQNVNRRQYSPQLLYKLYHQLETLYQSYTSKLKELNSQTFMPVEVKRVSVSTKVSYNFKPGTKIAYLNHINGIPQEVPVND